MIVDFWISAIHFINEYRIYWNWITIPIFKTETPKDIKELAETIITIPCLLKIA